MRARICLTVLLALELDIFSRSFREISLNVHKLLIIIEHYFADVVALNECFITVIIIAEIIERQREREIENASVAAK